MNKDNLLIVIIKILFFLINASFLIAGAIICKNTNELGSSDEKFHLAWVCTLVLTCISGVATFLDFVTCCGITKKEEDKNNSLTDLMNIGGLGVAIWALVLWFEELNLNEFENSYYSLFMLMQIRVYFTLVIFGILALVLVCGCGCLCVAVINEDKNKDVGIDTNSLTFKPVDGTNQEKIEV